MKILLSIFVLMILQPSLLAQSNVSDILGFHDYKFGDKNISCPKGYVNDYSCSPSITVGGKKVDQVVLDTTAERGIYSIGVLFKTEKATQDELLTELQLMLIKKYGAPNKDWKIKEWNGGSVRIQLRTYYDFNDYYVRIDYFKFQELKEVGL